MTTSNVSGSDSVSGILLSSGDVMNVYAGGTAVSTTVSAGGTEIVWDGGVVTYTTISYGGTETVLQGGAADYTTVSGGGTEIVSTGGTTLSALLYYSSVEIVSSGGTASLTTIYLSGVESVTFGGSATGAMVSSGGAEIVADGGTVLSATVYSDGSEVVSSGGTTSAATISSGGFEIVSAGGTADFTTVSAGGWEVVLSGGAASGTVLDGGGFLFVAPGGTAEGTVLAGGTLVTTGVLLYSPVSAIVDYGASAVDVAVSAGAQEFLLTGGVTDDTTVGYGGTENVVGGVANHTLIGWVGTEIVSSGGTANFATVSVGGTQILEGGTASGTVVEQGGTELVSSGGTTRNTAVLSGGTERVAFGAVASATTIYLSGDEIVDSLGSAVSTMVSSGGWENVASGGIESFATVSLGGSETVFSGASATSDTILSGGTLEVEPGAVVAGATLAAGAIVDFINVASTGSATVSVDSAAETLTYDNGAGTTVTIGVDAATLASGASFSITSDGQGGSEVTEEAACYRAGTRLRTARGGVAIEALRVGDLLDSALGGRVAVQWIGRRRVECLRHPRPGDVWPVHVAPGAFAPDVPGRDLWLSPDHAVFVDGVLIPIRYLLNDATIRQEQADTVTYYHVELPQHDVVFAEGLPAESYLDTGNRGAFENGGGAVQLHPDFALRVWDSEACADLVISGARLAAARAGLLERAQALGHVLTDEPDLRLVVDGRAVAATREEGAYRFALPAGGREARLLSRSAVPALVAVAGEDHRRLGVAVASVALDGRDIALTDAALGTGWHPVERSWRWTGGEATIALAGARVLELRLALVARVWRPAPADAPTLADAGPGRGLSSCLSALAAP